MPNSDLPYIKLVPVKHGPFYFLTHLLMFQAGLDTYWVTLFGLDGKEYRLDPDEVEQYAGIAIAKRITAELESVPTEEFAIKYHLPSGVI